MKAAVKVEAKGDNLMRLERLTIAAALALLLSPLVCPATPTPARADSPRAARLNVSLDNDWRFLKGDAEGAERPEFDDSAWRRLDVPHDWSIEGPFDEANPTGKAGGYLPAGVGWYRKRFTLRAGERARRVFVEFDGVMANSDVWVNGLHLGRRPYGYVSFRYELTGHVNFGPDRPNVIAVRADNSGQPASR
ncbi:MAG TPA: beta galactosidase jelly roll domain-containing protein, partial [Pyrinomonadaceae bacterium]|nr:beta galactosidase jelly roll domain-containing protein [Pyrinomonadaceae bacterium]